MTDLERPRFCSQCLTTVARHGSLCTACADDYERGDSRTHDVPNAEECGRCGGICDRDGTCGWCLHVDTRLFVERGVGVL